MDQRKRGRIHFLNVPDEERLRPDTGAGAGHPGSRNPRRRLGRLRRVEPRVTAQSAWPQDYTAAMSFLHEALSDFADIPTGIEAQAFVSQNACLFRSLKTCYIFATFEREANVAAHPRY